MHEHNSYITLTYNDHSLPEGRTLLKKDFTLWIKRFRKQRSPQLLRYYMCGEYGDELGRPHYHALLFGVEFPDKREWKTEKDIVLYSSKELTESWGMGHCTIGNVTFQSAAYVARYVMKKIGGDAAQAHYLHIDKFTGECINRLPEYTHMSLKPGIGSKWFDQFNTDVYPEDFVILAGKRYKTPKYYDRLFQRLKGEKPMAIIKHRREVVGRKRGEDNTPLRLAVKEKVLNAKLSQLKRTLS